MKYDVFICHSSKDKTIANAICNLLEGNGVTCWIAPRNIRPGSHYGEEIVNAIESSLSVLLVLTENANESLHVRNEVELGVSRGKVIFPVLIRNVKPSKALVYYISTSQWVEAWTPPLEQKIIELSAVIKALPGQPVPVPVPIPIPIPIPVPVPVPVPIPETDPSRLPVEKKISSESLKGLDELYVILSDQLEQHSFDKACSTISKILAIDRDNTDALNAQAIIDRQHSFGKIKSFTGPGVCIDAFYSADGHKIIAGFGGIAGKSSSAKPPAVFIWDVDSEQKLFEFSFHKPSRPTCMTLSPDEQTFLIGDLFSIYLISIKNKNIIADYQAGWIQCVSFLPEGNKAITGGNELLLWDFESGSVIYHFKGHEGRIQSLAVTPDGKKAVTGGQDATIRLWDLQKKNEIWCREGFKVNFQSIAISSDGTQILAGGDKIIRLLDLNTGNEMRRFTGHNGYTLSIAFSPDGNRAISGGTDNILRAWDLNNGHQIRGYILSGSWTGSVGFSKDGRFAISSDISNVNIWAMPE